jgi:hypothetical protein
VNKVAKWVLQVVILVAEMWKAMQIQNLPVQNRNNLAMLVQVLANARQARSAARKKEGLVAAARVDRVVKSRNRIN